MTLYDWGLGDSGFDGLENSGINITTPGQRDDFYSIFSSRRIAIENIIESLRNWKICKYEFRLDLRPKEELLIYHNKIWTIIAVIYNEFS